MRGKRHRRVAAREGPQEGQRRRRERRRAAARKGAQEGRLRVRERGVGQLGRARLLGKRLITCGGDYSWRTGYQGNVVVFAHLTGVR